MGKSDRTQIVIIAVIILIVILVWLYLRNRKASDQIVNPGEVPYHPTRTGCQADADCPSGTLCNVATGICGQTITDDCSGPCPAGPPGPAGADGADGVNGLDGAVGPAGGTLGAAEFVRTIQSPNNSVPTGTAFTVDTQVFNSVPTTIVASAGAGGTVWTLNTAGTYIFDYQTSLGSAGSIALYKGAAAGSLLIDNQTIAGSSTATTWIAGRAAVVVPSSTPVVVAVSSASGTAAVVTSGNAATYYTIRVLITRVA